jgi:predicted RNase H-like HicB family nuclease
MKTFVIIRAEPSGQFTAQLPGIPELKATATTREEAIQALRSLLSQWLQAGQLVALDLPVENPWLEFAGWAKDDPDRDMYLEELTRAKKEDLERTLREYDQECSDSSSTPTT